LTNTTYACISIEGKGYEIIKSYPIKEKEFLGSKIVSHLLLTIPVIIIANIIETIIFKLSMKECVIGFLLPISFTYFTGMLGCVLNITFPNFNWKNISFIVKRSIAAISSVFFSIGVVGVSFWVMFKNFNDNLMEAIYCLAMLMIVIDIGVSILLSLRAKKVCENLQLK